MEQILQTLIIFLLVFLNGFFVTAEFAIVKVRPSQIDPQRDGAGLAARTAIRILGDIDAYLSACQVGITFASLGLGWIGEPFIAAILRKHILAPMGIFSPTIIHTTAFGIAFAIITYLHIVLGEMAPKSIAIRRAKTITLLISVPLDLFYQLLRPFISILNHSALIFLKIFGVNPETASELALSGEELKLVFTHSAKSGHLTGRDAEIMKNVLSLHDKSAKQIIIPRTAIVFLSATHTFKENMQIVHDNQHTRYPLCDGDLDHVIGMINIKDVFQATTRGDKGLSMSDLKRDMRFYPETISLDTLFRELQREKQHMAILIDEYGGTTGIATLEDVLEELVGEIYDEFDSPVSLIRKVGSREYLIDGLCPVQACEQRLKIKLPRYEVETVGGIVFSLAGQIPEKGSKLPFSGGTFVVEKIDGQRIAQIRLILQSKDANRPGTT